MVRKVIVACVSLNQWAMDFLGNTKRVIESIKNAKILGARLRCGQELEISGYSCGDHFLEHDTFQHSWEVLAKILEHPDCQDILCAVGMPVMHKCVSYNCQVYFLNGKVLLIRPKMAMCDDGNYRESRWFTRWNKVKEVEDYYLPNVIRSISGQKTVPVGDALIQTPDTCIASEICEEMWAADSRHIDLSLDGAEIIANGSASYHQLRKLHTRIDLVKGASKKVGGVFMFSNGIGCDGDRVFWDGGANIFINGKCVAQGPQFSLQEVIVVTAVVELDDVQMYRNSVKSRSTQASMVKRFPRIYTDFKIEPQGSFGLERESPEVEVQLLEAVEEIRIGPACWLWDYLRRSDQGGFFLPLSGGIDSSSTACIVASMCHLLVEAVSRDNESVKADLRKITKNENYRPSDPKELASQLFTTCYMGSENSSQDTKNRAKQLAEEIGSYHFGIVIDAAVTAVLSIFKAATTLVPKFDASPRENLALQNVQARIRMVLSYLFAQLSLWARGRPGGLLVLGSANVDESLRGYLTKYDCSSADINPIGGISKTDLRSFIRYCHEIYQFSSLETIYSAPPTAELQPLENGVLAQTDEDDMGMTYEELSQFGKLRKQNFCGPFSMFCKLVDTNNQNLSPEDAAQKVKHFFKHYSINRHKMTVLTPSYHCESYSPDDNRFDQRQFLYNIRWSWQFLRIKEEVKRLEEARSTVSSNGNTHPSHVNHDNAVSHAVAPKSVSVLPSLPNKKTGVPGFSTAVSGQQNVVIVTRDHKRNLSMGGDGHDSKKSKESLLVVE